MNTLFIQDCVSVGWETFKKRPWFFVTVYVLFFLVTWSIIYNTDPDNVRMFSRSSDMLVTLISVVVTTIVEIILINLALKAEHPETLTGAALLSPMPFWNYLVMKVATGLIIFVGMLLLVIPGVVFALMFAFAPYLVVDKHKGPIEAMRESARVTQGHKWELLGLFVVLGLINVVGILLFFVGLLVTLPISAFALVHAYRKLEHRASEVAPVLVSK